MTAETPGDGSARPPRLRRLERIFSHAPVYFLTTCTAERRHLLATTDVHAAFGRFVSAAEQRRAWVGCYVIMPDHLHLFVVLDDEQISLAAWMKSLKNAVSKTLRSNGVPAPHWQKGFFDHVLRGEESYAEKWNYVRENPVRAGLVARAEEWPYQGEIHPLEVRRS